MKFAKFLVVFVICFFLVTLIVLLFPRDNSLGGFANNIQTAHFLSDSGNLTWLESIFYHLLNGADFLITKLDNVIPFFPSIIRVWWWTAQGIAILFSTLLILLLSFLTIKKPKIGIAIFILFSLWLIPISKIATNSWGNYVIKHNFNLYLPWSKKYVWIRGGNEVKNPYTEYQYSWRQSSKTEKAEIRVSCLGHYRLSVNGRRIYHGPTFADLPSVYFDTLNLFAYIKPGQNSIDIVCIHITGITHEYPAYPEEGLLVGGKVQDGLVSYNLADNRLWKYTSMQSVKPINRIFDAGYLESYDLGKEEVFSKTTNEFDPGYKVISRPLPLLKYRGASLKKNSDQVYDLGKFTTGYLTISSKQDKSCVTNIIFGVSLDQNGFPNKYVRQEDSFKLSPREVNFEQISRRSGRYIGIEGNCDNSKITLFFSKVYNNFSIPPKPKSTSQLDKEIFKISLNSLTNDVQDHLEDSPERERATYLGDSVQVAKCLLSTPGNIELVKQVIIQFANSQNGDGSFPSMTPSGLNQFIPSYSLQWPTLLNLYLSQTNDKKFAEEMWPHLLKLNNWAKANESKTGFFYNKSNDRNWWNFFDWTPTSQALTYQTQNQLWYLRSLEITSDVAKLIGKDPNSYQKSAIKLQKNLLAYTFDKNTGIFYDSFDTTNRDGISLVTNALAGSMGLFPNQNANNIAIRYFGDDYFTQTPYSESWVVDWFINAGRSDLAVNAIRGYWGKMVMNGATSIYEKYNPETYFPDESLESYSHAWGCGPIYEYPKIFK